MDDHVPNVRSVCACVATAPLGWPVVPEVKMMSETSPGWTPAARAAVTSGSTPSPAARKSSSPTTGIPAGSPVAFPPSSRSKTMRPSLPVSSPASIAG